MTDRRAFLGASAAGAVGAMMSNPVYSQDATVPHKKRVDADQAHGVDIVLPRNRVPLSFVIDDSTCLVNMGHFCNPQFAEAWPNRDEYKKPWRRWPREIPDSFVREFGEWCADHGVKGKYSVVPYPACVGWLDRELPGWSRRELQESLKLVRELMVPHWDIHPEMITHTRVIDLKTGRPMEAINAATMENSFPQQHKSVDELASYLAYALRILERCDLPCEGITTPGGFGNRVKSELSLAVDEAVRDVYRVDLPHYFKYVHGGDQSTEPILEHVRGVGTEDLRLTVNVPAGTGDWFGGWQGDQASEPDRYANADASAGRMVDLIRRRQPAVMLCHWPGIYSNGSKNGFHAFQRIVTSLADRFGDETQWMKLSDIGRYWAAKELTSVRRSGNQIMLDAPFATRRFTIKIPRVQGVVFQQDRLRESNSMTELDAGAWVRHDGHGYVCIDLPKGKSLLSVETA